MAEVVCKILRHTSKHYKEVAESPDVEATDSAVHIEKLNEKSHDIGSFKIPQLPQFNLKPDQREENKFYYGLRIVTGSQSGAEATASAVYIKLAGVAYASVIQIGGDEWFSTLFKSYFGTGQYDDILIASDAELDIEVFTVGLHFDYLPDKIISHWYVDFMQTYDLQKVDEVKTFPCYHWIGSPTNEVSCTAQTTTKEDVKSNPVLLKQREDQLDERKKQYKWKSYPNIGFPSSIDEKSLPLDEEFERAKEQNFLGSLVKGGLIAGFAAIQLSLAQEFEKILGTTFSLIDESVSTLEKFEEFAIRLKAAEKGSTVDRDVEVYEAYRWVSDVEFGRQILNGVNPVVIRKCTTLPSNFPVTNEMVQALIPSGNTLTDEMRAGHVYICDLSEIMHGLICRKGHHCPAPICLLIVNNAGQLVPIAIQLKKIPGPKNPIFLPTDHWMDWLLAKIYYRCAESQHHQLSTHYISCHATMEAYGVAVMRNLPDPHPVHRLLRRHFRYTMAINSAARQKLINDGGIIDHIFSIGGEGKNELVRRSNNLYRVQWNHIKKSIKERGVDNPDELPGYHYRDDGIKVWDAIEDYTRDIINIFYESDAEVENDSELREWARDVHTAAFPAFRDAPTGRGFPESIKTKDELVDLCALIIFTGSAQHAAVNFGQFDVYGYVPNAPMAVRQPCPEKKGKVNYSHILNSLPDMFTTFLSVTTINTLVQFSPDEILLGGYPHHWFAEEEAREAEKKFVSVLNNLQAEFHERNRSLDVPYEYLLPKQVPNSITI